MTNEQLKDLLRTSIFKDINVSKIDKLIENAEEINVSGDTTFLREGDVADAFFIIKEGSVQIFSVGPDHQEIVIAREDPGDFFGEQALLTSAPGLRNASVRSLTDCTFLKISHESFLELIESEDRLKKELTKLGFQELLRRFRNSESEYDVSQYFLEATDLFETKVFKPGETIIRSGDPAGLVYFLLSGHVDIYKKNDQGEETFICTNMPNNLFGESSHVLGTVATATVKARDLARALVIPGDKFKELYQLRSGLKRIVDTLQEVYHSPQRGQIKQYFGKFLHMPTVINRFALEDGRELISNRIVGRNIQSIREINLTASETVIFEDKKTFRELELLKGRLIGLSSYGEWRKMPELYARVLDAGSLTDAEIKNFREVGDISLEARLPVAPESDQIVCKCMYVKRSTISKLIKEGATTLPEISTKCQAGTVCGSCIPTVQAMLGRSTWQPMHIIRSSQTTADMRVYHLLPIRKTPLQKFRSGQHVVIQCEIEGRWIERSYTLSSASTNSNYYEIAVKREEKGLFSRWLFANDESVPFIRVSAPRGTFGFDANKKFPMVFLAAGIGITPAVSFARTIVDQSIDRRLQIYATARSQDKLPYASELRALAEKSQRVTCIEHYTLEKGRLKADDITQIASRAAEADYFVCGPKEFTEMCQASLIAAGIKKNKISTELFVHAGGPRLES